MLVNSGLEQQEMSSKRQVDWYVHDPNWHTQWILSQSKTRQRGKWGRIRHLEACVSTFHLEHMRKYSQRKMKVLWLCTKQRVTDMPQPSILASDPLLCKHLSTGFFCPVILRSTWEQKILPLIIIQKIVPENALYEYLN